MKRGLFYIYISLSVIWADYSCNSPNTKSFGEIAKIESGIPIHPGEPGTRAFWNKYAERFIYAPSFNYKLIEGAEKYQYKVSFGSDSGNFNFLAGTPNAPLTPVWTKMPVGYFNLKVIGISGDGDSIGIAGEGRYYRAACFNGPYHQAVMPYDSSGMMALYHVLHESYVSYWLSNNKPDPGYKLYRYPAKMFSALISGSVAYARYASDTNEVARAVKIAETVADYLLRISFPKGSPWEYFPPTYYGEWIDKLKQASFIRLDNFMPMYGTHAGNAYLDLYDLTGNKKYLEAAEQIAGTFLKRQLKNGSWYLYVNPRTEIPTSTVGNVAIPTFILNYFDRLRTKYKMKGLSSATQKALNWIMANPVKTYNWQGQFEDVGTHEPYKDLNRKEACQLAIYLFKKYRADSDYIKMAEELIRFSEDQFVIWEKPRLLNAESTEKGRISTNWITPSVQEQYAYWMPTSPAAMRMMKAYWYAYKATHKEIYLAKAESLANTMTLVQKIHQGDYSTYFTNCDMEEWLNCIVYSARDMIWFGKNIDKDPLENSE